jgi:hypothetical protein
LLVSSVATSWAPSAPPSVRMIVLIPVATPTSSRGTDSTTMFAIDANAKPMPRPISAPPTRISQMLPCAAAKPTNASERTAEPSTSGSRDEVRARRPASGPANSITAVLGSNIAPAPVTVAPKP